MNIPGTSKNFLKHTAIRKCLIAFFTALLIATPVHAEKPSQARQLLDAARLLAWNYQRETGHQLLWRVFLKGETFSATQLEIAEAADLLVRFGGTKDDKEYLYLRTWAAEAGYPPAMHSLATSILGDYARAKTTNELLKELLEYPKVFSEQDALVFLQRAAEEGDPNALRKLGSFHKKGKGGFLYDPYRAEELYTAAINRRIEIGRAGDHHELIAAAKAISQQDKTLKNSEAIIEDAIEMAAKQPGGMDLSAAEKLVSYYAQYFLKEDAAASAQEYRWLLYGAYRVPPRRQNGYLSKLSDYFAGDYFSVRNFIEKDDELLVNVVAAHALFNVVGSRMKIASRARDNRDALAKRMSEAEIKLALDLARKCTAGGHVTCLDAVDQHFSRSGS